MNIIFLLISFCPAVFLGPCAVDGDVGLSLAILLQMETVVSSCTYSKIWCQLLLLLLGLFWRHGSRLWVLSSRSDVAAFQQWKHTAPFCHSFFSFPVGPTGLKFVDSGESLYLINHTVHQGENNDRNLRAIDAPAAIDFLARRRKQQRRRLCNSVTFVQTSPSFFRSICFLTLFTTFYMLACKEGDENTVDDEKAQKPMWRKNSRSIARSPLWYIARGRRNSVFMHTLLERNLHLTIL